MNSRLFSRLAGWIVVCTATVLLVANQQARGELEFGIPTPVPAPINDVNGQAWSTFSPDELIMYFISTRPVSGGILDIWMSSRVSTSDPWSQPQNLGPPVNSAIPETSPSISSDGLELYFGRALDPLAGSDADLWVARRPSVGDPWGEPEELAFNTDGRDWQPSISPDGLYLYFDSNRPVNEYDLNVFVARRDSTLESFDDFEVFEPGALGPSISPDGLTFLFDLTAQREEELGQLSFGREDLWIRTRETTDDEFGPLVHLHPPINSSGQDFAGVLFEDKLYFSSSRPGVPTGGIFGEIGIWQAPIAEAVPVDIKPGSDPNSVNMKSKGVLPVAIVSTDEFDALEVDPDTLVFGDPLLIADGEGTPVAPIRWAQEDVTGDGLMDLTLKFSVPELVANQVLDLATVEGYLTGTMLDGTVVAGRDAIRIVGTMAVPEPSTLVLVALGFVGLLAHTRRRRK